MIVVELWHIQEHHGYQELQKDQKDQIHPVRRERNISHIQWAAGSVRRAVKYSWIGLKNMQQRHLSTTQHHVCLKLLERKYITTKSDITLTFSPLGPAGPGGPMGPVRPWDRKWQNSVKIYWRSAPICSYSSRQFALQSVQNMTFSVLRRLIRVRKNDPGEGKWKKLQKQLLCPDRQTCDRCRVYRRKDWTLYDLKDWTFLMQHMSGASANYHSLKTKWMTITHSSTVFARSTFRSFLSNVTLWW